MSRAQRIATDGYADYSAQGAATDGYGGTEVAPPGVTYKPLTGSMTVSAPQTGSMTSR